MPSPLIHTLLPASFVAGSQIKHWSFTRAQWIRLLSVSVILANIPDLDWVAAMCNQEHFYEIHRSWGHNIFAALAFTFWGAFLLKTFVSDKFQGASGFITSGALVMSHLILDSLGHFGHDGFWDFQPTVPLFWPLSHTRYGIPFQVFFVRAAGVNWEGVKPHFKAFTLLSNILRYEVLPICVFLAVCALFQFGIYIFLKVARKVNPVK